MNERVQVLLQDGFVLHYKLYRETSLILEIFTRDFGKLSVIAKGARRARSKFSGLLQPFRLLKLSWCGKSDLCTLTDAEIVPPLIHLSSNALYCGFYLNELLNRFLHRNDPDDQLFSVYGQTLSLLASGNSIEQPLRIFELVLLDQVGYGLQIEYEMENGKRIDPDKRYKYIIEKGPVEVKSGKDMVRGSTLIGLQDFKFVDSIALYEAKRLLRRVIDFHLGGKPLISRSLFGVQKKIVG